MLEILETLPLIAIIPVTPESNTVRFKLDDILGMAKDYSHSACIGLSLLDKNGIPDNALQHITLLLASREETKDYALQLHEERWWLWLRCNAESNTEELSILLEQLLALSRYIISQVSVITSLDRHAIGKVVI